MELLETNFLQKIECLGDNCELGFVLRQNKYEKGGLFRWSITPIDSLLHYLQDPTLDLYSWDNLSPFSPGMVIDNGSGFSFHTAMRSEKNTDGVLQYIADEKERLIIYEKEKSKIDYLRSGFLERLQGNTGSIYVVKCNKGIDNNKIKALSFALKKYSNKHVLIVVKTRKDDGPRLINCDDYYAAYIERFAPYIKANDVLYSEWQSILETIRDNTSINSITA